MEQAMTRKNVEFDRHLKSESCRIEQAQRLLPAWFIGRMMTDEWQFGLLLDTGVVMAISSILEIHQAADGSLWIDVEMLKDVFDLEAPGHRVFCAPTSQRTTASIAVNHIVAAFELPDS